MFKTRLKPLHPLWKLSQGTQTPESGGWLGGWTLQTLDIVSCKNCGKNPFRRKSVFMYRAFSCETMIKSNLAIVTHIKKWVSHNTLKVRELQDLTNLMRVTITSAAPVHGQHILALCSYRSRCKKWILGPRHHGQHNSNSRQKLLRAGLWVPTIGQDSDGNCLLGKKVWNLLGRLLSQIWQKLLLSFFGVSFIYFLKSGL